jgi:SAM-dependent methyltransferase
MAEADRTRSTATFKNRARASSFGANAELYDETRPRYPAGLLDALMAHEPTRVLDVGCGTGILGRDLLARGAAVLGIEPDEQMAAIARRHGLDVELGTFEDWDDQGRRFDLLVAGQAWHWVDPVVGAARAGEVVVPGGRVVLAWNHAVMPAPLRVTLDEVYARHAPVQVAPTVPHRTSGEVREEGAEAAFAVQREFGAVEHVTYPWEREYSSAAWRRQLETHSDHAIMEPGARNVLLDAAVAAIDEAGGAFTMHYDCETLEYARH